MFVYAYIDSLCRFNKQETGAKWEIKGANRHRKRGEKERKVRVFDTASGLRGQ